VLVIERRIGLLFAGFLVLLALGAGRAAWLGVVRGPALKRAAVVQQQAVIDVPARRGSITDTNGIDLAVSEAAMDIAADPYLLDDATKAASQLAPLLGTPEDQILKKLAQRSSQFVYLGRRVPLATADKIEKLKIPGLDFIPEYRRTYPNDWMAAQLLGSTGTDGTGLGGLEYRLNPQLTGTDGERKLVKDAMGTPIEMRDTKPVREGRTVRLTLDANLQQDAEKALTQVGEQWKPKDATAIVMNPNTGALLAVANWPAVNANDLSGAPASADTDRAVSFNYEPGSTFKVVAVSAALEEGKATPNTEFYIPSELQYADRTIKDAEDHPDEDLTTSQILKVSSNIGAVLIGKKVGTTAFNQWMHRFGFGKPTGVDIPGEQGGIVPKLADYSGSTMGNLPIGQGVSVTPMQMAAAYAAIANGGILRSPHVVASVGDRKTKTPKGKRIISEATAASVRAMLEGVLGPGGTASGAAIPGYTLAGKTGTAQIADKGGYSTDNYVASFVGFAPAKDPKLLVLVMVDEPRGDIYGGQVAAPAWKDIVNFSLNYLKISPH
jgi:cell division protein FtsI (penicillin-binding protein 3)